MARRGRGIQLPFRIFLIFFLFCLGHIPIEAYGAAASCRAVCGGPNKLGTPDH